MWTWKKTRRSMGMLRPHARIHLKWLVRGTFATIGLVLLRLALPWPLKGVIDTVMSNQEAVSALSWLPSRGDPVLWLVGLFGLIVLGVGVAEMIQRVCMAKFATHTVHDLRSAAVRGASRQGGRGDPGELISRIIGDAARVKESLKGILIHASQNGLLFLGVAGVFAFISPQLSLYYLLGGVIAILVGFRTSSAVATVFRKQRRNEGQYAAALFEGLEKDSLDLEALNKSSATKDVRVTKMITLSSLVVHLSLAATTGVAVWAGSGEVRSGTLSAGDLFLFITYALTVHHRVVQVGRQLARSGKVLACVDRIGALIDESAPVPAAPKPLVASLRLEGAALKNRIEPLDLNLRAGSRVALLGGAGSGKSSLLRLLSGVETPDAGRIAWDEEDLSKSSLDLMARVGFLGQDPTFPRRRLWRVLGLPGPESPAEAVVETCRKIGAWKILSRMPNGLREKVGSATLSRNESRILKLGATLFGGGAVWALDAPLDGLSVGRARRTLRAILEELGNRTLIASLARPVALERFDRVIVLENGRIRFDGSPQEWKERKLLKS